MPYAPRLVLLMITIAANAVFAQETAPAPLPAAGGAALPTAEDIHKQVDAGQFRDALKSIMRILDLKGPAAAGYDRVDMLLLRAECQLQIRETTPALDALTLALKEASAAGSLTKEDPVAKSDAAAKSDAVAKALALSALVAKSPGMLYTPKTRTPATPNKPINILDRTARPDAYRALFTDLRPEVTQKVQAALKSQTMPPILETAKSAATLRALELQATGSDTQSKDLTAELAAHAAGLLFNAANEMTNRVNTIEKAANQVQTLQRVDPVTHAVTQVPRRGGLSNADAQTLKSIQQTCVQISTACADLSFALSAPDKFLETQHTAEALHQKAATLLGQN